MQSMKIKVRHKPTSTVRKRRPIVLIDEKPDNFSIGSPSNRKAKKALRLEKKKAKIEDRSYKKRVKADALAKRTSGKAEAAIIQAQGEVANNAVLAQQGIQGTVTQQPDYLAQGIQAAGGLLGGKLGNAGNGDIYGAGQPQEEMYQDELTDSSLGRYSNGNTDDAGNQLPAKKNNTMMYLIIAAVAVAAFMFMKKK